MNGRDGFLLLVLVATTTVAGFSGCLGGLAASAAAEETMTVPFPRLGDRAVFDVTYTDHETAGELIELPGGVTLEVMPTTSHVAGGYGDAQEVYTVHVTWIYPDHEDPSLLATRESVVDIDVETNLEVRSRGPRGEGWGSGGGGAFLIGSESSSRSWENATSFTRERPWAAGGEFQGETVRLEPGFVYEDPGDEGHDDDEDELEWWQQSPFDAQRNLTAGAKAEINGILAYGIVGHSVDSDGESRGSTWLSPDVPYVVMENESGYYSDNGERHEYQYRSVLASYEPGTVTPVRGVPGKVWASHNEAFDWKPTARGFPAEGSLPFARSLKEAEAAVRSDAQMKEFQGYLTAHPEARIETAWFRLGETDSGYNVQGRPLPDPGGVSTLTQPVAFRHGFNWVMVFTSADAPNAARYLVANRYFTNDVGQSRVRNAEIGSATYDCMYAREECETLAPPAESPSLAALVEFAQPYVGAGEPNYLFWGLDVWSYDIDYTGSTWVGEIWDELWPLANAWALPSDGPFVAVVGAYEERTAHDDALLSSEARREADGTFVHVDAASGGVRAVIETHETERQSTSIGPSSSERTPEPEVVPLRPIRTQAVIFSAVAIRGVAVGGASLGFAALAAAYFWPMLKFAGTSAVMPLYAKIRKDRVLDQKTRETLMELVRTEPGINPQEIRRRTGLGWGTVVHHLRTLEKNRLVMSAREGRYRRFFAVGSVNSSQKPALALMKNAFSSRVLDLIRDHPGISHGELAREANLDPGTVTWHIKRMRDADMLRVEKASRRSLYFVKDALNN